MSITVDQWKKCSAFASAICFIVLAFVNAGISAEVDNAKTDFWDTVPCGNVKVDFDAEVRIPEQINTAVDDIIAQNRGCGAVELVDNTLWLYYVSSPPDREAFRIFSIMVFRNGKLVKQTSRKICKSKT